MSELTVNVSKVINAPIEAAFDAWLNPATLSKFMLPRSDMPNPEVTIDAVEGGEFSIMMKVGDNTIPHHGHYVRIERPETLVFTWISPFSAEGSEVSLEFTAINTSSTRIELTHRRFLDEESRDNHLGGWSNILSTLNKLF